MLKPLHQVIEKCTIYHYQCPNINCPSAYIGESGRSLGERVKEHFKAPSPIHHHSTTTGHPMDPDQFNILHKEVNSHSRTIKEAMFICMQDPTPNRTWASTSCHTYGTTSSRHLLLFSTSPQTIQPHQQPPNTPYWFPPNSPTLPLPIMAGGTYFFLKVSTHACPKYPPLLIYNNSYNSAILVSFLHFIC